jgi:hypothetical protein
MNMITLSCQRRTQEAAIHCCPREERREKMKKAWMAMVLGALLLGTMAGAVWARPKQMLAGNRKLAIGPAAFEPAFDGYDYQIITWEMGKDTAYMSTTGDYDEYVAPVVFPTLSPVTVKKITLIVNDMNETDRCRA